MLQPGVMLRALELESWRAGEIGVFSLAGAGGGLGLGGWPETEEGPAHYFKAGSIVILHFSFLN